MVTVNPDPHEAGYRYSPTKYLTAIFTSQAEMSPVVDDLADANLNEELQVFVGNEGVERLDVSGKNHGVMTRLYRDMEQFFTDETDHLRKTELALKAGGFAIAVLTGDDEAKKARAVAILKSHQANEICYWGRWATERM